MGFWDRFRRADRKVDAVDNYELRQLPSADPWASAEARTAMERRASRGRMDAEALDGFRNELTGIGSWQRDKTFGGRLGGPDFDVTLLSGFDCENRWRGSDLGAKVVEAIPDEMTREGFKLTIQPSSKGGRKPAEGGPDENSDAFPPGGQPPPMMPPEPSNPKPLPETDDFTEDVEAMDRKAEEMAVDDAFWEALCYERAYGGALILVGADDGLPLDQPLDEERLSDVTHLTAFRGGWDGEAVAWSWNSDITKKDYGKPDVYMIRNIGTPIAKVPTPGERQQIVRSSPDPYGSLIYWVHASRLLVFPGVAASRRARVQMRGWGDSIFTRIDRVLSQYDQTWGGISALMTDFSQGYLKVKGLLEMLGAGDKSAATLNLTKRAQTLQLTRAISNLLLIDSEEEFGRDTASLAGVSDILDKFMYRLAAAADMPVDLLFSSMNSSALSKGDSTVRFFYDRIASKQKKRMLPQRKRLTKLMFLAADGPTGGDEPDRWEVAPKPLMQLSDMEKATLRKTQADTDHVYVSDGVVSPEEVAASRFAGAEYSTETVIDFEGRREQADLDAQKQEDKQKLMSESARAGVQPGQLALTHPEHPANAPPPPGAPDPGDGQPK